MVNIPYYMINYRSLNNEVIGLRFNEDTRLFTVVLRCNKCGSRVIISTNITKSKIIRCKSCKAEEILIVSYDKWEDGLNIKFIIVNRMVYRKLCTKYKNYESKLYNIISELF